MMLNIVYSKQLQIKPKEEEAKISTNLFLRQK